MTFIEWITEMPPISSEWKSVVSSTIKLSRNIKDIPFHKNVSIQDKYNTGTQLLCYNIEDNV